MYDDPNQAVPFGPQPPNKLAESNFDDWLTFGQSPAETADPEPSEAEWGLSPIWDGIGELASDVEEFGSDIVDSFGDFFGGLWGEDSEPDDADDEDSSFMDTVQDLGDWIVDGVEDFSTNVVDAVQDTAEIIGEFFGIQSNEEGAQNPPFSILDPGTWLSDGARENADEAQSWFADTVSGIAEKFVEGARAADEWFDRETRAALDDAAALQAAQGLSREEATDAVRLMRVYGLSTAEAARVIEDRDRISRFALIHSVAEAERFSAKMQEFLRGRVDSRAQAQAMAAEHFFGDQRRLVESEAQAMKAADAMDAARQVRARAEAERRTKRVRAETPENAGSAGGVHVGGQRRTAESMRRDIEALRREAQPAEFDNMDRARLAYQPQKHARVEHLIDCGELLGVVAELADLGAKGRARWETIYRAMAPYAFKVGLAHGSSPSEKNRYRAKTRWHSYAIAGEFHKAARELLPVLVTWCKGVKESKSVATVTGNPNEIRPPHGSKSPDTRPDWKDCEEILRLLDRAEAGPYVQNRHKDIAVGLAIEMGILTDETFSRDAPSLAGMSPGHTRPTSEDQLFKAVRDLSLHALARAVRNWCFYHTTVRGYDAIEKHNREGYMKSFPGGADRPPREKSLWESVLEWALLEAVTWGILTPAGKALMKVVAIARRAGKVRAGVASAVRVAAGADKYREAAIHLKRVSTALKGVEGAKYMAEASSKFADVARLMERASGIGVGSMLGKEIGGVGGKIIGKVVGKAESEALDAAKAKITEIIDRKLGSDAKMNQGNQDGR